MTEYRAARSRAASTAVPNAFIDQYLTRASGDFVKVYLALLRCSVAGSKLTLPALADALAFTERDIRRAIRYWEKEGVLAVTFEGAGISKVEFLQPATEAEQSAGTARTATAAQTQVTTTRAKELKEQAEVAEMLFAVEDYMIKHGGSYTPTTMRTLLYFHDDLRMPLDLIEYLVEYCVSMGKTSLPYIRTVGLAWYDEGYRNLRAAKAAVKKRQELKEAAEDAKTKPAKKKNAFHNFSQRMNDYDKMEKELLRAQRKKK